MLHFYTWASNSLLKVSSNDGVKSKYINISQLSRLAIWDTSGLVTTSSLKILWHKIYKSYTYMMLNIFLLSNVWFLAISSLHEPFL